MGVSSPPVSGRHVPPGLPLRPGDVPTGDTPLPPPAERLRGTAPPTRLPHPHSACVRFTYLLTDATSAHCVPGIVLRASLQRYPGQNFYSVNGAFSRISGVSAAGM